MDAFLVKCMYLLQGTILEAMLCGVLQWRISNQTGQGALLFPESKVCSYFLLAHAPLWCISTRQVAAYLFISAVICRMTSGVKKKRNISFRSGETVVLGPVSLSNGLTMISLSL